MSNNKSTRRKRVKKFTKEYNRKLKKAEESTRELIRVKAGVKAESKAILSDLLSLIPISQQTIDYSDAGLIVNIKADIPSDKYIALLRRISKLND